VTEVTGEEVDVTWAPARPQDVHSIVLDTRRLRRLMHWDPMPLAEGLSVAWDRRQRATWQPVGLRTA